MGYFDPIKNLDAATEWLLLLPEPAADASFNATINDYLMHNLFVQHWVNRTLPLPTTGPVYYIKAGGIHYDLLRAQMQMADAAQFEYWVVQKSALDWAKENKNIDYELPVLPNEAFYIVRSSDNNARREIVLKSDKFIDVWTAKREDVPKFAPIDANAIHCLRPELFPDLYKDTFLNGRMAHWDPSHKAYVEGSDGWLTKAHYEVLQILNWVGLLK